MAPPLLTLRDARITFGGRPTFAGVSLSLGRNDRACLVGRNGGGKSTLLKALAGSLALDGGERFQQPGARIIYMPQESIQGSAQDSSLTAADFVAGGLPGDVAEYDRRHRVEAALDEVGVAPGRVLGALSGGEGRRLSLARALAGAPDILLLDEPTNHLDVPAILWLEERLAAFAGGFLMVSHDRAFLTRLSHRTFWLDRGTLREHDAGYAAFEEWSETILAAEAAEQARLDKRIASETVWLRQGISARRRRNQGRVRRLAELRRERAASVALRDAKLGSASAEAGGRLVIAVEHIAKSFHGDGCDIVVARDFSTRVLRGDRVGVIGPNGAGKSTLLGMLAGTIAPDRGTVRHGTNLMPAMFDQRRAALDLEASPWTTLAGSSGDTVFVQGKPRHVASYLKDFLFEDRQFKAKVGTLSGGERNRLFLAKILAQPSNLLILDEPTNDLDLETLDLLEEVLTDYDGTVLLVSHDRDFLDRIVSSVIAVEGNGVIAEYVGGYADYLRQRPPPRQAKAPLKSAAKRPGPPAVRSQDRLSWKEQRELEALPGLIAELEAEKARLETALADPGFFQRDRAAFEGATARHPELVASLGAAEERWLSLAERAERLARGAESA